MDDEPARTRRSALAVLAVWSVAFGYLEAAVVVYLRRIFYPEGFRFPLVSIPDALYGVEIGREAATLALLWGIAWFAGRSHLRRFAAFMFAFGTWDIVYYAVLKLTLDWPSSLLEWDILFLIPAPWTGPVLAPVLVSLALVTVGALLYLDPAEAPIRVRRADIAVEVLAGSIILATFFWNVPEVARGAEPRPYPWGLFLLGLGLGVGWFAGRWVRGREPREQ